MLQMPWHIYGHSKLLAQLESSFLKKKDTNTLLITGPANTGKFTICKRMAQFMHCENGGCLSCNVCRQIEEGNHIDTFVYEVGGNDLGIKEFRELKKYLNLSAQGKYKVVIIQNIERLSIPSQNAMLKILEEPPDAVYFFLTCSNFEAAMPTIVSRCRVFRTGIATDNEMTQFLSKAFSDLDKQLTENVTFFAAGRIGKACQLVQDDELYQNLINWLAEIRFLDNEPRADQVLAFAEKLASLEKDQVLNFLTLMIHYFRSKMIQDENSVNKGKWADVIIQIQQTYEAINHNINLKLALEVLFLQSFCGLDSIVDH
jgi:DNA polymerase-3 subunit delta'